MPDGSDNGYHTDPNCISYPEADQIVEQYLADRGAQKAHMTSRDVLKWQGLDDSRHNQRRIHDALDRVCDRTDSDWAGRTVFQVPHRYQEQ